MTNAAKMLLAMMAAFNIAVICGMLADHYGLIGREPVELRESRNDQG